MSVDLTRKSVFLQRRVTDAVPRRVRSNGPANTFSSVLRVGLRSVLNGALAITAVIVLQGCSESNPEPDSPVTPALTSLMTAEQYRNSLEYIFGPGIDLQVEFAPVARTEGLLANSASIAGVSSAQLQGIQGVAASVAKQVVMLRIATTWFPVNLSL